jgi:hypothetical protein
VLNEKPWSVSVRRGPSADGAPLRSATSQAVAFGRGWAGTTAIQRSGGAPDERLRTAGSASISSAVAARTGQTLPPAVSWMDPWSASRSIA